MKPNDKAKRNNIGSHRPPQKLARQLHGHAFHYSPASFELTLGLHPALPAVGACCARFAVQAHLLARVPPSSLVGLGGREESRDLTRSPFPDSAPLSRHSSRRSFPVCTCNCCGSTSRGRGSAGGFQDGGAQCQVPVTRLWSALNYNPEQVCGAMDRPGVTASLVVSTGR